MTSPYLQKPRRELDDVVHGQKPAVEGEESPTVQENSESFRTFDFFAGSEWYILCVSALVVCAVLAAALTIPDPEIAQFMMKEPDPEGFYDMAPAAGGPGGTAAEQGVQLNHSATFTNDPFDQVLPEGSVLTPTE